MKLGPFSPHRRLSQVQELCAGQTLQEVIKTQAPLREERAASLFRGIIKSVLHCHQVGAHVHCTRMVALERAGRGTLVPRLSSRCCTALRHWSGVRALGSQV